MMNALNNVSIDFLCHQNTRDGLNDDSVPVSVETEPSEVFYCEERTK